MKTGLVLEGGGMRGVFTTGVLDVFLDENIDFDLCIGVSAGSGHACSYLSKQRGRGFKVNTDYLNDKRYCSFYSLITTGDMFGAKMLYHTIPEELYPVDNETFKANRTEFQAAVTNIETGKPEYPVIRDLFQDIEYIRASSSLPLLARIVELDGKKYLDGGISDSMPVTHAVDEGCDKIVVILTQVKGYVKKPESFLGLMRHKYKKYPEFVKNIENRHNMYNDTLALIEKLEAEGRVLAIRPETDLGISRTEKDITKLKAAYAEGEKIAKERISAIKEFLGI